MKVGLFFGSFNPIHLGHLVIAESLLNYSELSQVWLMVTPLNPMKEKNQLLNEYDRLRMCELATEDNHRLRPSNIEFKLPKPSYTIDTLNYLKDQFRSYDFCLLMGEDNLATFHKWKNYETILKYYNVYVYPRLNYSSDTPIKYPNIWKIKAPIMEISSTEIREHIRNHRSIKYLVPDSVIAYIYSKHLYGH